MECIINFKFLTCFSRHVIFVCNCVVYFQPRVLNFIFAASVHLCLSSHALKSLQAVSRANMELESNISELFPASIMRVDVMSDTSAHFIYTTADHWTEKLV